MTFEFDDKGKFYTEIIQKEPHHATIMTATHKITGLIYIRPDQRMKDELDLNERFMAMTDAVIYNLQDEIAYRSEFIAIQRSQIIWVIPETSK